MATTLLATAVRGSAQTANLSIPGGAPAHVQFDMVSATFPTDASLTFGVQVERSFDGGTTWENWFGASLPGGTGGLPIGKNGTIVDGLYHQVASFDGRACLARATLTVNTPFSWGITATVLAT